MIIEKIETQTVYPNIYKAGVTQIIHIAGERGALYSFNRNALGVTWFAASITKSRPSQAVIAAANAA